LNGVSEQKLVVFDHMSSPGIFLPSGRQHPDCQVHIDTVFYDLLAIQFCASGSLYFQRGELPLRTWEQPVFFWTDCRSHYRYGPGASGAWEHHWVQLHGPAVESHFLPLLEHLAPEGCIPVSNARECQSAILDLISLVNQPLPDSWEAVHKMQQFLVSVQRGAPGRPSLDARLRNVREELEQDPGADWDFSALARKYGFSYSHFRRRFREQLGSSPRQYLISLRLREVARGLMEERGSIQELAAEAGYEDAAHFSKLFKQRYGVPPARYRQALRQFQG